MKKGTRRMIGKVSQGGFNEDKGFCFVLSEGKSYFLHVSKIADPYLQFDESLIGQQVEFDIERSDKGEAAVNVRAAQ
jgi:cold shock CspA family protein